MGKVLKIAATVIGVAALVIPGVGSVIGSALISVGVGAGVATAIVTSLGIAAFASGVKSLAGAVGLGPKPPQISGAETSRLQANVDTRAARKIVFGRTAANTDVAYQEFTGTNQDTLNTIVTLASHALESIDEVWFDDKQAWTSGGGVGSAFSGYLAVTTRTEGTVANAFTITGSSSWTAGASRMVGNAYVWLRYTLSGSGSPFASSISARMTFRVRGAKLYDPRRDSTVGGSGTHRASDQATWAWVSDDVGRNPALQLLWYLLGWRIQNPVTGQWKLAVGLGLPVDRIDIPSFMAAANICDELVALAAGGAEPRYRSDGVFGESDDPSLVFENLCAAMNGVLRDNGGKLSLEILRNDLGSPVVDLGEADVIDGFTWLQTPPIDQTFNIIRGQYVDPSDASLYQPVDYPDVVLTSPDGIDRSKTFNFGMVQSASQAQRLAKTYLQRAQYPGTFTADFLASAWRCQVGSVVRLTFPALGFNNKLFRVIEHSIRTDGRCPMVLREEDASIYAWSASEAPAVTAAAPISYNPLNDPLRRGIDAAGDTALWPNVTGTGKPADFADVTSVNVAAGIAGQGDLATANRAALPFGTNLLVNTELLLTDPSYGGGVIPYGWQSGWSGNSTNLGSVTFNDRRVLLKDGSYAFARDLTGAPNGTVFDCLNSYPSGLPLARFAVPVLPGDRLIASALVGHQNCTNAVLIVGLYDENGTYVEEFAGSTVTKNIGTSAYNTLTRSDLTQSVATVTVAADGTGGGTGKRRWAVVWCRFLISGSPTNPRAVVSAPMLSKAPANQTAVPLYVPGPADRQASYGATTGSSLVSTTYGTLSDSDVKTNLGTAAAIAGQAAWATYTGYTPAQVTNPGANLLFNSGFKIGTLGWVPNAWAGPNKAAGDVGAWYMSASADNTYLYSNDVTKTPVFAGNQYTFQVYAAVNGSATGGQRPYIYIDWHKADGSYISSSSPTFLPVGAGYVTTYTTATAPALASYGRVVMVSGLMATTGGNVYTSKWKLELGGAPTPYSDETTNGALYQSGQTIDSLKPAQVGADVTGSNTAAAIAGQGDLATSNRASLPFGQNAFANSDMTSTAIGWEFVYGNNASLGGSGGRNVVGGYYGRRNVAHCMISSASAIANTTYMFGPGMKGFWSGGSTDVRRFGLPVKAGDRVYLGGKFSIHGGSTIFIRARFFNESGTLLNEQDASWNIGNGRSGGPTAAAGEPTNFAEQGAYFTVPSGAYFAMMGCYTYAAGGDTSIYIFVTEPIIARVPASQTATLTYTPGLPDKNVDATGENVAAAIIGQGTGATASSLAGLDPTAAATLASLTAGASQVATYGDTIQIRLAAGASVNFSGRVSVDGSGSSFGDITCQLQSSPSGANTFSTFASGGSGTAGPGEPRSVTASGSFTNSTGIEQVFDFRVEILRTPGGAGGAIITSRSYIAN